MAARRRPRRRSARPAAGLTAGVLMRARTSRVAPPVDVRRSRRRPRRPRRGCVRAWMRQGRQARRKTIERARQGADLRHRPALCHRRRTQAKPTAPTDRPRPPRGRYGGRPRKPPSAPAATPLMRGPHDHERRHVLRALRCRPRARGVRPARSGRPITPDHLMSARRSVNLVQARWANRGTNSGRWTRRNRRRRSRSRRGRPHIRWPPALSCCSTATCGFSRRGATPSTAS